jgi:hypothetical protein
MTCSALKLVVGLLFSCSVLAWSEPQEPPPGKKPFPTAEGVVAALYEAVTFEAGSTPDWDHVRSMFIDGAVIVLRTSRQDTTVFSVEGFVDDFVKFIERADAGRTGFSERIIRTKPASPARCGRRGGTHSERWVARTGRPAFLRGRPRPDGRGPAESCVGTSPCPTHDSLRSKCPDGRVLAAEGACHPGREDVRCQGPTYGQGPQLAGSARKSVTPTSPSPSKSAGWPGFGPHAASMSRKSVTPTVPAVDAIPAAKAAVTRRPTVVCRILAPFLRAGNAAPALTMGFPGEPVCDERR